MMVLLMRTFSCVAYLPLFDLSLKLIIFKEKTKQKQTQNKQTNKHKNHHQENPNNLFTSGSVCDFATQLVLWVHASSKRRNSDKQIISEQDTSPVEISTTQIVILLERDVQKYLYE